MNSKRGGKSNKLITYRYKFKFFNGKEKEFTVNLDSTTLDLIHTLKDSYPEWVELRFFKCPHCPLDSSKPKYCPVAVSLFNLVSYFGKFISYEEVDLFIETLERKYIRRTTLQKGLSSLFAICMVTSGCPVMAKLRPMARFHLPFATEEETKYRALSMYLLAQYFIKRRGKKPDWEMKNLIKVFKDIRTVYKYISKRLVASRIEDASINALVVLDNFADSINFSLTQGVLNEIEVLFNAYVT
jgi:hypothetical protein